MTCSIIFEKRRGIPRQKGIVFKPKKKAKSDPRSKMKIYHPHEIVALGGCEEMNSCT